MSSPNCCSGVFSCILHNCLPPNAGTGLIPRPSCDSRRAPTGFSTHDSSLSRVLDTPAYSVHAHSNIVCAKNTSYIYVDCSISELNYLNLPQLIFARRLPSIRTAAATWRGRCRRRLANCNKWRQRRWKGTGGGGGGNVNTGRQEGLDQHRYGRGGHCEGLIPRRTRAAARALYIWVLEHVHVCCVRIGTAINLCCSAEPTLVVFVQFRPKCRKPGGSIVYTAVKWGAPPFAARRFAIATYSERRKTRLLCIQTQRNQ